MSIQMQADDFFNAYIVLKDNNEALMERLQNNPGEPLIGTNELGTRITGSVDIVTGIKGSEHLKTSCLIVDLRITHTNHS